MNGMWERAVSWFRFLLVLVSTFVFIFVFVALSFSFPIVFVLNVRFRSCYRVKPGVAGF